MEYQLLELIPTIDSHCVLLVGSSPINPNIASTYREGNLTGEKLAILSSRAWTRGGDGRRGVNVLTNNKSGADSLVCLVPGGSIIIIIILWVVNVDTQRVAGWLSGCQGNCLVFSPVRNVGLVNLGSGPRKFLNIPPPLPPPPPPPPPPLSSFTLQTPHWIETVGGYQAGRDTIVTL